MWEIDLILDTTNEMKNKMVHATDQELKTELKRLWKRTFREDFPAITLKEHVGMNLLILELRNRDVQFQMIHSLEFQQ